MTEAIEKPANDSYFNTCWRAHYGTLTEVVQLFPLSPSDYAAVLTFTGKIAKDYGEKLYQHADPEWVLVRVLLGALANYRRQQPPETLSLSLPDYSTQNLLDAGTVQLLPLVEQWQQRDWAAQLEKHIHGLELLWQLPEKYRLPLWFHDRMQWSWEKVAEVLGITLPTAQHRVHRARLFLLSCINHILADKGTT
jgi:hypothetical protein